jgi:hypothetical protein
MRMAASFLTGSTSFNPLPHLNAVNERFAASNT